jgi:Kef-type K+ transport system membrane component KefB
MSDRASSPWAPVLSLYAITTIAGGICLTLIFHYGQQHHLLDPSLGAPAAIVGPTRSFAQALAEELHKNFTSPLAGLVLQVLTVLIVSRLCGVVFGRLGQPRVMGEILAGILLGPSLLKIALPDVHAFLFPESSLPRLFFLSNIGLILFMFTIGLELNIKALSTRARSAVLISHLSIIFPFILGSGLSLLLYDEFGPRQYGFVSFAMFIGISMSITAFPVLARIIQENNLTRTTLGVAAITSAAIDDVTAWCILAVVVGITRSGSATGALAVIFLAVLYIVFALMAVRPALAKWLPRSTAGSDQIPSTSLAIVFMILLASCLLTETIGIHALFGAFVAGVIMPELGDFKHKLTERVQDVSTLVLLPLFFAYTGLRTQIGLLNDVHAWLICGLVVFVAVLGKMGGTITAARWTGLSWREAAGLGALMNTRGLVELIVLNIGYDLGILNAKMFTMLIIMAIFTTMMTGPLLRLFGIVGQSAKTLQPAVE